MSDSAAADAAKGPSKKELNKLARKNKAPAPSTDNAKFTVVFCKGASPELCRAVELQLGENGNVKYCINKGTDSHLPILKSIADGDSWSVSGDENIARYLVRVSTAANAQSLYGDADSVKASQIDQWLSVFDRSTCVASVRDSLVSLANTHLSDKTYFVGTTLTLADIAIWTALRKLSFVPAFETAPHASRWFELVSGTIPWSPIVVSVAPPAIPAATAGSTEAAPKKGAAASNTAAAADADADEAGATGSCPPLDGAVEGQVCTRFPPEPSGYLHIGTTSFQSQSLCTYHNACIASSSVTPSASTMRQCCIAFKMLLTRCVGGSSDFPPPSFPPTTGHAKAVLLNQYYAQHYKGKLLVRFDDTNPSKEKDEFHENIIKDLATLNVIPDSVSARPLISSAALLYTVLSMLWCWLYCYCGVCEEHS
jgi:glutamyl-tRNA synthetase